MFFTRYLHVHNSTLQIAGHESATDLPFINVLHLLLFFFFKNNSQFFPFTLKSESFVHSGVGLFVGSGVGSDDGVFVGAVVGD